MAKHRILYPSSIPMTEVETVSTSGWGSHSTSVLSSTSDRLAIPFVGDGSEIDTIRVWLRTTSQAGTLNCRIEGTSDTPNVNNVSGFPDGTTITNGTATGASVTGGVNEIVELTFSTNPTPTGLHWLVFTATSGGTVDIDFPYSADWHNDALPGRRIPSVRYWDGADWNNVTAGDAFTVQVMGSDGNQLESWLRTGWGVPYIGNTNFYESTSSGATLAHGVQFVVDDNLTELVGIAVACTSHGTDDNTEIVVAKSDGTVLGRSSSFNQQNLTSSSRNTQYYFDSPISLTAGDTVRIALYDPEGNDVTEIAYFDLSSAGDQETYFCLSSGELSYCSATDPPERGASGSGSWTSDSTKLPLIQMIFEQDLSTISGGGGGGGETTSVFMA